MVLLPGKLRVGDDIDAVQLTVRMKRAYMRPHVRALPHVVLAVRTLETLRCSALISVVPRHVTAVFVAAIALRARMTVARRLDVCGVTV